LVKKHVFALCLILTLPARAEWQNVRPGIDYQRMQQGRLDVHVARIDLRQAELRVIATDREHRGLSIPDFARRTKAIVAINGDYFTPSMETIGMAMGACGVWNRAKSSRTEPVVAVGESRVEIQTLKRPASWMTGAVAGWPSLLSECAPRRQLPGRDSFTHVPHARTAVGLSRDGETLWLVTTAARGATLPDLAEFMASLGACRALNLDGGRSTGMWLNGTLLPGSARGAVANHLAVIEADDYSACRKTKGNANE
jgi:exopolysaccharide biosynthesis protein